MAMRAGLLRRFGSTLFFTPETIATAAASTPSPASSPCLFVTGLNKRTTSDSLKEAFSKFGEVVQGRVIIDRVSGTSKGFGFVRFATLKEAEEGRKGMDGQANLTDDELDRILIGQLVKLTQARNRKLYYEGQMNQLWR